MKKQAGLVFVEVLIIIAIMVVFAIGVSLSLRATYASNKFQTSFGVEGNRDWSDQEKVMIGPSVQKILSELRMAADEAWAKVDLIKKMPETLDPKEAVSRIERLRTAVLLAKERQQKYDEALNAAIYFGLVDLVGQKSVPDGETAH